jgi:hypothetical protein
VELVEAAAAAALRQPVEAEGQSPAATITLRIKAERAEPRRRALVPAAPPTAAAQVDAELAAVPVVAWPVADFPVQAAQAYRRRHQDAAGPPVAAASPARADSQASQAWAHRRGHQDVVGPPVAAAFPAEAATLVLPARVDLRVPEEAERHAQPLTSAADGCKGA